MKPAMRALHEALEHLRALVASEHYGHLYAGCHGHAHDARCVQPVK